jgi:hypothetical protein
MVEWATAKCFDGIALVPSWYLAVVVIPLTASAVASSTLPLEGVAVTKKKGLEPDENLKRGYLFHEKVRLVALARNYRLLHT